MRRSVLVIAACFFVVGGLSFGGDLAFRGLDPEVWSGDRVESTSALLLAQLYVSFLAVFGCWLCARLAPDRPMRHALLLGGLGVLAGTLNTVALWSTAPAWYHLLAITLVMPLAWAGGRLRELQLAHPAP